MWQAFKIEEAKLQIANEQMNQDINCDARLCKQWVDTHYIPIFVLFNRTMLDTDLLSSVGLHLIVWRFFDKHFFLVINRPLYMHWFWVEARKLSNRLGVSLAWLPLCHMLVAIINVNVHPNCSHPFEWFKMMMGASIGD